MAMLKCTRHIHERGRSY